jgi:hypothetical protein
MADQERENREEREDNREGEGGMDREEESPVRPDRQPNSLTPEKEELAEVEPGQESRPEGGEDEGDSASEGR